MPTQTPPLHLRAGHTAFRMHPPEAVDRKNFTESETAPSEKEPLLSRADRKARAGEILTRLDARGKGNLLGVAQGAYGVLNVNRNVQQGERPEFLVGTAESYDKSLEFLERAAAALRMQEMHKFKSEGKGYSNEQIPSLLGEKLLKVIVNGHNRSNGVMR